MKKKLLTLALALTMLLTLFAGCGNQPTGSTVSAAEVPTEPAVAKVPHPNLRICRARKHTGEQHHPTGRQRGTVGGAT